MDVCESEQALPKQSTTQATKKQPLLSAQCKSKNGAAVRAQTCDNSPKFRSATPSAAKRHPSPTASPLSSASSLLPQKWHSRPSSTSSPSTPIQDTSAEMISRKLVGNNKLPESLWPSTMRSLNVSFQSDTYSIPVNKREKPASHITPDRTLRPSSNVAHRQQAEISGSRKPTPERKRSPLKGKIFPDQTENSKPFNSLSHSHVSDQHRWPSGINVKVSGALNRSIDLADKMGSIPGLSRSGSATPFVRRSTLEDGASKPQHLSTSNLLMQLSRNDGGKLVSSGFSVDESLLRVQKPGPSCSSDRTRLINAATRALCSPARGSQTPSPSMSRGASPSRGRHVSSPSKGRPSSPSKQPQGPLASVLSFIADIKKGKKGSNQIEDVHQLRMLYNRHLQWRYANARTYAALEYQQVKVESMLYSLRIIIADLWDSIMEKSFKKRARVCLDVELQKNAFSHSDEAIYEKHM